MRHESTATPKVPSISTYLDKALRTEDSIMAPLLLRQAALSDATEGHVVFIEEISPSESPLVLSALFFKRLKGPLAIEEVVLPLKDV